MISQPFVRRLGGGWLRVEGKDDKKLATSNF